MRFRFYNLNSTCKSYISRLSSQNPKLQTLTIPYLNDPFLISDNPNYTISKRWHLGHSHHDHGRQHHSSKEGDKVFRLGLAADIGLATGKALTGYLTGSTAIIADAAHSVSDVVLSGVALWSFKIASAPKDKDHPYGHGKFETLGALGISCMLLATAGGIAWHAADLLLGLLSAAPESVNHSLTMTHEHAHSHHHGGHHHGIDMAHPILALRNAIPLIYGPSASTNQCHPVLVTAFNICLFWITKRAGEKEGSGLMKANAWHHRADAISSVVTLVGVGGAILGVKFLDPLAGLVVSGLILKAGLETGHQSVMELVDAAIPAQQLDPIRETILQIEGVKGCHRLRGRRAGSSLYLDVHIEVDPFCSVGAAHDIGENVRHQIHESHPGVAEVFIHIDPSLSQILSGIMDGEEKAALIKIASDKLRDVKDIVFCIVSRKLPEGMTVEEVTSEWLQGRILLNIEVSILPGNSTMGDAAVQAFKEAENEILKAVPNAIVKFRW